MPNRIRTVIIDHDQLSIDDLKVKLLQFPKVYLVGDADTVCSGVQLVQNKVPDLLFLNIEMPEKSGFDIMKLLKTNHTRMPFVIFITEDSRYHLQALRTGAIDYLQKPINVNELGQALNRASEEILKSNQNHKIDHLLDYISKYKQIFLPSSTGYKSVNTREICFIRKVLHTGKVEVVFDEDDSLVLPANYSLLQLTDVLPKNDFFQVKRELIINLRYLSEVEIFNKICVIKKGDYTMKLGMSRRSLKEFKNRMVI